MTISLLRKPSNLPKMWKIVLNLLLPSNILVVYVLSVFRHKYTRLLWTVKPITRQCPQIRLTKVIFEWSGVHEWAREKSQFPTDCTVHVSSING